MFIPIVVLETFNLVANNTRLSDCFNKTPCKSYKPTGILFFYFQSMVFIIHWF